MLTLANIYKILHAYVCQCMCEAKAGVKNQHAILRDLTEFLVLARFGARYLAQFFTRAIYMNACVM